MLVSMASAQLYGDDDIEAAPVAIPWRRILNSVFMASVGTLRLMLTIHRSSDRVGLFSQGRSIIIQHINSTIAGTRYITISLFSRS